MLPSRSPTVVLIWAMARRSLRNVIAPFGRLRAGSLPFGQEYSTHGRQGRQGTPCTHIWRLLYWAIWVVWLQRVGPDGQGALIEFDCFLLGLIVLKFCIFSCV